MKQADDYKGLIGYQIQRAHLLVEKDARLALDPFGLTPAKLTALLLVRDNPGCDQTTLGQALSINRSSAMKLVNILVERNLIERRPGRDARTNALHLTSHGAEQSKAMLAAIRESDARVTAALSADEVAGLRALLARIIAPRDKTRARARNTD